MIVMEYRTEFCYNLQYMEKNNRGRPDPWSLRQSGVYEQKLLPNSGQSNWIFLQPAREVPSQLKQIFEGFSEGPDPNGSSNLTVHIHLVFISFMARNWQEYLEHLQAQLAALVRMMVLSAKSRIAHLETAANT
jgi:hypothetical protein